MQNQNTLQIDAQRRSREEELRQKILQHKMQLHQKESEWADRIRKQTELSQQLEEKCKDLKSLESKRLKELKAQLQAKQLETERFWTELTNTWAAEKISKDCKITS